jgi:hypothetical protein
VAQIERCILCKNKPKLFQCTHPIDNTKLAFGAAPKTETLKDEATLKAEADAALERFKKVQSEKLQKKEGGDPALKNFMQGI